MKDIKTFIESGILESYVLGDVTAAERAEVERMAADHPEVREEIIRIEETLEVYAQLHRESPPPGTLQPVLERTGSSVTPPGGSNSSWWRLAAVFLGLMTLTTSWLWLRERQQFQELAADYSAQVLVCDSVQQQQEKLFAEASFLRNPGTRSVVMAGTEKAPDAEAIVFYNPALGRAYLSVSALPPPPSGKQYQLWALIGGQPVDMGVFDLPVTVGQFQDIPFVAGAEAFAVTLEDLGGKPTPNLEALTVIGLVG